MREVDREKNSYAKIDGLPVDICIFTVTTEQRIITDPTIDKRTLKSYPKRSLQVLLVQRRQDPFRHQWALPGGFTHLDWESLDEAARRELKEETNLDAFARIDNNLSGIYLEQMRAYYQPDRDPRGKIPTVAYVAIVHEKHLINLQAGGDARQARLFHVRTTDQGEIHYETEDHKIIASDLAFDHGQILLDALHFVQNKMITTTIASTLLPEAFTIAELYQVIATVVPSFTPTSTNFARDLVKTKSRDGLLEEVTDEKGNRKKTSQFSSRPAQLYKFRADFEPRISVYPRV